MIAIACLVLLALAATALAVSPAARDALRDLFDIGGVTIETTHGPRPGTRAAGHRPRGADNARRGARPSSGSARWCPPPWAIPTPRSPTPRYRRWPSSTGPGRACPPPRPRASGCWSPSSRAGSRVSTSTRSAVQATTVERLRVGGRRAAWIAGAPHFFFFGRGTALSEHRARRRPERPADRPRAPAGAARGSARAVRGRAHRALARAPLGNRRARSACSCGESPERSRGCAAPI